MAASLLVTMHVDTSATNVVNHVRPDRAIGTGVDSDPLGKIPYLYAPAQERTMLGTGLGALTYRLYTELSIQDWHWNPSGSYSDSAHRQGYWTSDATPAGSIVDSFGYRLPHRGSTRDQGDDDGYSRIDDGDPATYWKSNPYLAQPFTHESDAGHPQWMVVVFNNPTPLDALTIHWANPYATHFRVQYWSGSGDAILAQSQGEWRSFTHGDFHNGSAAAQTVSLESHPRVVKFVRVLMDSSSNTCDTHGGADRRNCVGYAVSELSAGTMTGAYMSDRIVHSRCGGDPQSTHCRNHQTVIFVSSIDPWHSATDRNRNGQDQPGLDVIARSRITHGLGVMYPVPLFYSTPDNAVAEIRYLRARKYPVSYIELGEEVDGQYAMPEDYASLYIQWARAIHRFDPTIRLGGPVFEGVNSDVAVWRNAHGDASWLHRFVEYLRAHGAISDLAFMSFEHYPFHNCDAGATLRRDLLREPSLIRNIMSTWRNDGLPAGLPLMITEANFSADGTGAPQRIDGALWTADYLAQALTSGAAYAMYYQIETEPLGKSRCSTWGAYNPYFVDSGYRVRGFGAAYHAARMLTIQWLAPGDDLQDIYGVRNSLGDDEPAVTAYVVKRPDFTWSVLIVNKDIVPREVALEFGSGGAIERFAQADVATFGSAQYHWDGNPKDPPSPDDGIVVSHQLLAGGRITVAPESLTVVRGALAP